MNKANEIITNIIKDAFLFHNEKWDCAEMVLDEQL